MVDLKKYREKAGMTQEELAEKVGVIRQTISNVECGVSLPSIRTAVAIGYFLHFNWTEFFEEQIESVVRDDKKEL